MYMIKTSTPSTVINESNEMPRKHVVNNILNYSKSLVIQKSKMIKKVSINLN